MFKKWMLFLGLMCLFFLVACSGNEAEPTTISVTATEVVAQVEPTATTEPSPTATATPTETPLPTDTPTPVPTNTPEPTATKAPVTPTRPRPTPAPTRENRDETTPEAEDAAAFPDGNDILARNKVAVADVASVIVQQRMAYDLGDGGSFVTLSTCNREGENAYCVIELGISITADQTFTTTTEIVLLDGVQWIRTDTEDWREMSPEETAQFGSGQQMAVGIAEGLEYEAVVVGEETISEVPVYRIELDVDPQDYLELIFAQAGGTPADMEFAEATITMTTWVGQEDFLGYREEGSITISAQGETVTINIQIRYSNYNEPVEIPDPASES